MIHTAVTAFVMLTRPPVPAGISREQYKSGTWMLGEPKGAGTNGSVMEATTAFSRAAALSPSYTSINATGWFSTVVHSVICGVAHPRCVSVGCAPFACQRDSAAA